MRRATGLLLAASLAACGSDGFAPSVTEAPSAPPTEVSRNEAVIAALGSSTLEALGMTVDEFCATFPSDEASPIPEADLIVFLEPGATAEQLALVEREVRAVDEDATFVSQDDAYREFTEDLFADDDEITELVTPDLLPASFRLDAPDAEIPSLQTRFEQFAGVRKVLAADPAFEQFAEIDARLREACSS